MRKMGLLAVGCLFELLVPLHDASAGAPSLDVVATFDPNAGQLPESITLDAAGNLYLSMSAAGTVWKRTPSGQLSTFSTLPVPVFSLGVKIGPDGCLYTATTSLDPTVPGAFVWQTCTAGVAQKYATLDPSGGPNDLAFDDAGNLFVTDTFLGRVWKVAPGGAASVWLDDPLLDGDPAHPALVVHAFGVDGIAFDDAKTNLFLGNLDYGRVLRVPVQSDGSAGTPVVVASSADLVGIDGIAIDKKGNVIAANGTHNRVQTISPNGAIGTVVQDGPLDGPASVAFGVLPGDKHSLYIASLAFLHAFGIAPGAAHPSLTRTDVAHRSALP